jgi:hypothetical protein
MGELLELPSLSVVAVVPVEAVEEVGLSMKMYFLYHF